MAQIEYAHPSSSQNRSLRYLSAESGRMVTITARRPAAASSRAMERLATTAAAAEMPTSKPSSRASFFAMAYAASVSTAKVAVGEMRIVDRGNDGRAHVLHALEPVKGRVGLEADGLEGGIPFFEEIASSP